MRVLILAAVLGIVLSTSALRAESKPRELLVRTVFSGGQQQISGWRDLAESKSSLLKHQLMQEGNGMRQVQFLLKRANAEELEQLLWQVSDPQRASYGNHLSSEMMTQLISPQGDDAVRAITVWLHKVAQISQHQIKVAPHKDMVELSASWDQLEKLFPGLESSLKVVVSSDDDKSTPEPVYALVADLKGMISLPSEVAKYVELVGGLAEYPEVVRHSRMMRRKTRRVNQEQVVSSSSPSSLGLLTPQDIWEQYNLTQHMNQPSSLPGGAQSNTQAFLQLGEGTNVTDLAHFCDYFKVQQAGGHEALEKKSPCTIEKFINGNPLTPSGVRLESDMDAQLLVSVGQRPTWVYTYKGSEPCSRWAQFAGDVFNQTSDEDTPRVITISYGLQSYPAWCDNAMDRFSEDMKKFGVMGISVLSGSGDVGSGSHSRLGSNHGHLSPSFPSQVPYITSVGATDLKKESSSSASSSSGRPFSERAASFSGGGFSWNYTMPDYQATAVAEYMSLKNITWPDKSKVTWNYHTDGMKGRATPDVTACGSNLAIYVSGFGGWMDGMGTSASGPIVGGLVSQLNNVRLATANKTMGFINPFFYQNADCFYDITVGNTDGGGAGVFPGLGWHAAPGWDATSGLGALNFECLRERILQMKP